jgi:hypothetical protein
MEDADGRLLARRGGGDQTAFAPVTGRRMTDGVTRTKAPVPAERIANAILFVRGHKVMLDADLAGLYGVPTKVLLQAIRRNAERFPLDFMFELELEEWEAMRSQIVTSKPGRGGRRYAPYVFTEQGVAMLSSVLRTPRAIAVNIEIMRAFVRLRETLAADKELAKRIDQLEASIEKRLAGQDRAIVEILQAIRQLMAPPSPGPKRKIGFL